MEYRDTQIIGSCGKRGRGKTCLIVAIAYDCYLRGWNVYSNLHSTSDQIGYRSASGKRWSKYITPNDLLTLKMAEDERGFVLLDEAYVWYESRTSNDKKSKKIPLTYRILQSRKLGYDVGYSVQLRSSIDLRLRFSTDILFSAYKPFVFDVIDEDDYIRRAPFIFRNAPDYYDLFNTKEVVGEIEPPQEETW